MTPQEKRELLAWKAQLLHLKIQAAQKRLAKQPSGSLLPHLSADTTTFQPMVRAITMLPKNRFHRLLLNALILYFWPNSHK